MLQGIRAAPFRELFRHRIHKGDIPRRIRCNDTVADTPEGRCKPSLVFTQSRLHPVLVQRHLNGNVELALFERLENISERIRHFGPLQRMFICIRRQVDDRNCVEIAYLIRCGDAIHLSAQHDIHQHEVGMRTTGRLDGLRCCGGDTDYFKAPPLKPCDDVTGDNLFIFDNKY